MTETKEATPGQMPAAPVSERIVLLGSVTRQLVGAAPCPLLVVPQPG